MDDVEVQDILRKTKDLIKSTRQGGNGENLLQIAKNIQKSTDEYVSKKQTQQALNKQLENLRNKMEVDKQLLKTAITNAQLLKSKLDPSRSTRTKAIDVDPFKDVNKDNLDAKIKLVNNRIKALTKELRQKTTGTKLEEMLEEYTRSTKEAEEAIKSLPELVRSGAVPKSKRRAAARTDDGEDIRAAGLLQEMSSSDIVRRMNLIDDVYETGMSQQSGGERDWLNYEGFDTKEEMEKFKTLYKKVTGEDPDECVSSNENSIAIRNKNCENMKTEEIELIEMALKEMIH